MKVYYAPDNTPYIENVMGIIPQSIFLGGSIEMGKADNWQDKLISEINIDCIILNPRRKDWDNFQEQSINNSYFKEQVNWELDMIIASQLLVFYFDPNTQSPITLLELGYTCNNYLHNLIVCCPEGYFRKGNIDIICERHNIPQVNSFEELVKYINNYTFKTILKC